MLIEVLKTSTGSTSELIRYRASKRCRVEVVEGINRSAPCMITLCAAPPGADEAASGVGLAMGASNFAGGAVIWTGACILDDGEEIWALFNNSSAGDVMDLTIKAVML